MSKQLIIFPFGGNAREAAGSILNNDTLSKEWEIGGFIDDHPENKGQEFCGIRVLGNRELFERYSEALVLAVPGNPNDHLKRKTIIDGLNIDSSRFATIIHPSVNLSADSKVGYNTLILPNVVIGSSATIGNHCIVLANSTLSHDCSIADYCCIGSNVVVSGGVTVEEQSYIGSGANIKDDITIKRKSLVGLGANVIEDVDEAVVVAGNPAKIIRKLTETPIS